MKARKPLGKKAYGSIPHLPGSKFGDRRDKGLNLGEAQLYIERCKPGERVIVTEKLDGSCVAVARIDDEIIPLIRAGYPATSSPWEQHKYFAAWVRKEEQIFYRVLENGEHLAGEWLIQAHGTRYILDLRSPFVCFDLFKDGERVKYSVLYERLMFSGVAVVPLLFNDTIACPIDYALEQLGAHGYYGAVDLAEGVVYRRENKSGFVGIAKYVRPEKDPGCYLPETTGKEPIWNVKL